MSEWWTYRLSDFLLFSTKTYYRLFELYNREWWPLHLMAIAVGIAILVLAVRQQRHAVALLLAAVWLWVAWAFLWQRYSTINWAARWFAGAFVLQALLLTWLLPRSSRLPRREAIYLALFAVVLQPFIGMIAGRSSQQMELFGMTPDPTVIATLGVVLLVGGQNSLLVIPLIWCAISGATLWALGAPDALVLPVAGIVALVISAHRRRAVKIRLRVPQ